VPEDNRPAGRVAPRAHRERHAPDVEAVDVTGVLVDVTHAR